MKTLSKKKQTKIIDEAKIPLDKKLKRGHIPIASFIQGRKSGYLIIDDWKELDNQRSKMKIPGLFQVHKKVIENFSNPKCPTCGSNETQEKHGLYICECGQKFS